MVFFRILYLALFCVNSSWAQFPKDYVAIDLKASEIPNSLTKNTSDIAHYVRSNFKTESDKLRAIYYITTHLIAYDYNMFNSNTPAKSKAENIEYALRTKKGVCQHYAEVFTEVCLKSDIKAMVVEGYTKGSGSTEFMPHAWCAAFVNNTWQLIDPTWSSGYLENGVFMKLFTDHFYGLDPKEMIKTHLPYDPMFELLSYPVTRNEFNSGTHAQNDNKIEFVYNDSIALFEKLSELQKLEVAYRRTKNNGSLNPITAKRLSYLKHEIDVIKQNELAEIFNRAVGQFNAGINGYNRFIAYRNNRFNPQKPDAEIKAMLDSSAVQLNQALAKLNSLTPTDNSNKKSINGLIRSSNEALVQINEQYVFLRKYFKCDVNRRKTLF
jgi:hypothetical protein